MAGSVTQPGPGPKDGEPGQSWRGGPAGDPLDLARQLRDAADAMVRGWSAAAGPAGLPEPPELPAALSARRLQATLDDLAARRAELRALRSQLEAVEEQLGRLHDGLRPLLEWTRGWAELERAISDLWRPARRHRAEEGGSGAAADR
jgi:hypothetical protein